MYKFIYDTDQLESFYNCFAKELCGSLDVRASTSLKVMLQSRRKYNEEHHQSIATVTLLRRQFELHKDSKEFVKFIRRFEIADGLYCDRQKDGTEVVLKSDSMVLYVTSNALSRIEATKKTVKTIVNDGLFEQPKQTVVRKKEMSGEDESVKEAFMSLDSVFLTELHQSPSTKMQRFDVDCQEEQFIKELDTLLIDEDADVIFAIKTRSGYHYVVRTGPFMRKMNSFLEKNREKISVDKNGMNALPGTFQGGAQVQLIFAKGEKNYSKLPSLLPPPERKHAATETKHEVQS